MTGRGHRIVTFMATGALTGSPLAATLGFLGSTLPDSLEYALFGRARNRFHRKLTHWFVPWLALVLFCLYRAGWGLDGTGGILRYGELSVSLPRVVAGAAPDVLALASGDGRAVWACAAFWALGPVLHILEDACCGKVPFLNPMRRGMGIHLFRMSSRMGEMSVGEKLFALVVSLFCLAAWFGRGLAL